MKNIFIHIPKTAGNSVRNALTSSDVEYTDIGHSVQGLSEYFADPNVFTFCFVREPASRLKSAFYHLIEIDENQDTESLSQFSRNRINLKKTYQTDFKRFVLERGFEKFKIAHFYPQTLWTHTATGCSSFIGHLESLDSSWDLLGKELGTKLQKLQKLNVTKIKQYSDEVIFTDEMMDIIKEYYKKDYRLLGYN